MAIVEAFSCGLTVVSTNVGGIPEVLPPSCIYLVDPNLQAILAGVQQAVEVRQYYSYAEPPYFRRLRLLVNFNKTKFQNHQFLLLLSTSTSSRSFRKKIVVMKYHYLENKCGFENTLLGGFLEPEPKRE